MVPHGFKKSPHSKFYVNEKFTFFKLSIYPAKGQLISKCVCGFFNSPKKRTKIFDFTTMVPQVELFTLF